MRYIVRIAPERIAYGGQVYVSLDSATGFASQDLDGDLFDAYLDRAVNHPHHARLIAQGIETGRFIVDVSIACETCQARIAKERVVQSPSVVLPLQRTPFRRCKGVSEGRRCEARGLGLGSFPHLAWVVSRPDARPRRPVCETKVEAMQFPQRYLGVWVDEDGVQRTRVGLSRSVDDPDDEHPVKKDPRKA